jgi:hypothetical protein
MGAKRMDQLKDNVTAIHLKLTQAESKSLDEVSQILPEYPEWMLATQGADRLGPVDRNSVNQKKLAHAEACGEEFWHIQRSPRKGRIGAGYG